jgi:hypothetical protein
MLDKVYYCRHRVRLDQDCKECEKIGMKGIEIKCCKHGIWIHENCLACMREQGKLTNKF